MSDSGKEIEQLARERISRWPGTEQFLADIVEIIRISVDAGKSDATDQIASLRTQRDGAVEGCDVALARVLELEAQLAEEKAKHALTIQYLEQTETNEILKLRNQLASARKALELARSAFHEQGCAERVPVTLHQINRVLSSFTDDLQTKEK